MSCVSGFKRGFGAMALSFFAFILSIAVAAALYGTLSDAAEKSEYSQQIISSVSDKLSKKISDTADDSIEKLQLPAFIQSDAKNASNKYGENAAGKIAEKTVNILTAIVIMLLTYILSKIIIALIKGIIHSVTSLPVIHFTDSLLGFVFGAFIGVIWVGVIYYSSGYLSMLPQLPAVGEQYASSVLVMLISDFII